MRGALPPLRLYMSLFPGHGQVYRLLHFPCQLHLSCFLTASFIRLRVSRLSFPTSELIHFERIGGCYKFASSFAAKVGYLELSRGISEKYLDLSRGVSEGYLELSRDVSEGYLDLSWWCF